MSSMSKSRTSLGVSAISGSKQSPRFDQTLSSIGSQESKGEKKKQSPQGSVARAASNESPFTAPRGSVPGGDGSKHSAKQNSIDPS